MDMLLLLLLKNLVSVLEMKIFEPRQSVQFSAGDGKVAEL
jgi:hypothetical protein